MKKTPSRHLSWENFRSSTLVKGEQRVHRVAHSPLIEIFGDGIRDRIGLWLQVPDGTPVPDKIRKLAFIQARSTARGPGTKLVPVLELVIGLPTLHRHFYHFSIAAAERILVNKMSSVEAVLLELQCFAELLEEKPLLSIERQLGLLGELIVLDRIVAKHGTVVLDAWIGPQREPHDFRIEQVEYEVKTTAGAQRIHTIHGTEQLVPSSGCSLFLVSILLGPAGKSNVWSLADVVQRLSAKFAPAPARLAQFTAGLEHYGYRAADGDHYTRRFAFRRPLAVVPIDDRFPAITRPTVQAALGEERSSRIDALQYDVNVEGLEVEDGKPRFPAVLQG